MAKNNNGHTVRSYLASHSSCLGGYQSLCSLLLTKNEAEKDLIVPLLIPVSSGVALDNGITLQLFVLVLDILDLSRVVIHEGRRVICEALLDIGDARGGAGVPEC